VAQDEPGPSDQYPRAGPQIQPLQWDQVLREHLETVSALAGAAKALDAIVGVIVSALRQGRRVYLLGNGGSAADAQHIAAELVCRFRATRRPLPAIALTTDTSTLTAIGNDLGYEQVFARQLEALVQPGDIVWALSTSGNSPNVIEAVRLARQGGAIVIGFTGTPGGQLATLCDHLLRVPHTRADRIQEAHQLAYHYVCQCVEQVFLEAAALRQPPASPAR
jgi:D-sedoheptulose 7-phosphate isomerase